MKLFFTLLENKIAEKLSESREEDISKLHITNENYENIVSFIEKLKKNISNFERYFYKDSDGNFVGFLLDTSFPKSKITAENTKLVIEFRDKRKSDVGKNVKARSSYSIDSSGKKIQNLFIIFFVKVPKNIRNNVKKYNRWFVENIEDLLKNPRYRSSFSHEFTHSLDQRRLDIDYLLLRSKRKELAKKIGQKREMKDYINDPIELNAYYNQALNDLYADLMKTDSTEEWNKILGETPQEFAEKIIANYLRPQAKKYLTDENKIRFLKRASITWEYLHIR